MAWLFPNFEDLRPFLSFCEHFSWKAHMQMNVHSQSEKGASKSYTSHRVYWMGEISELGFCSERPVTENRFSTTFKWKLSGSTRILLSLWFLKFKSTHHNSTTQWLKAVRYIYRFTRTAAIRSIVTSLSGTSLYFTIFYSNNEEPLGSRFLCWSQNLVFASPSCENHKFWG